MSMFCYQCEQASKGVGCNLVGVCGKTPLVSMLQDILIYQCKGLAYWVQQAEADYDKRLNKLLLEAVFTSVTNVAFDPDRILQIIKGLGEQVKALKNAATQELIEKAPATALYEPAGTIAEVQNQYDSTPEMKVKVDDLDDDIQSVRNLLIYGLKGLCAYADHALILGKEDQVIFDYLFEAFNALNQDLPLERWVELNMKCGEVNIRAMELLDEGHVERYGHPEPTTVSTGTKSGPAIVVSGHDLLDLEKLLIATEGQGVNIYTHGEMLPAHGYPGLKKYSHLAGHFGTAWQNQQKEFSDTSACYLFTTNCIQEPRDSYKDSVFTTGLVSWPGVKHLSNDDFSEIIEKAKALGGFEEKEDKTLMTGFGRNAVLGVADKVIDAVKGGAIKHFFLVGGCDGAKLGRNYFTEFVEKTPKDTVILTLACGKFRFNHLELGDIGGIPRLLDVGQCNDAYSAIKIASALADAFDCGVNDLPLSLVLSWYEQKAVVILLSLLFLGIKGIRLGPTLPAFITPNILDFLVKNFDIKPVGEAEADLAAILG